MCQVPPEDHRRLGMTRHSLRLSLVFLSAPTSTASFSLLQIENSFSLSVPIFKQFHKNIIGKGGANIKKVSNYSPANVVLGARQGVMDVYATRSARRRTQRLTCQQRIVTLR